MAASRCLVEVQKAVEQLQEQSAGSFGRKGAKSQQVKRELAAFEGLEQLCSLNELLRAIWQSERDISGHSDQVRQVWMWSYLLEKNKFTLVEVGAVRLYIGRKNLQGKLLIVLVLHKVDGAGLALGDLGQNFKLLT